MTGIDPTSSSTRILECSKCHEPVAGDRPSGVVTFACACGHEEVRELSSLRMAEAKAQAGRILRIDLRVPPDGIPADLPAARLVDRWREAKASIASVKEDDRAAAEHAIVWLGTTLALRHVADGDIARARAVLETLLEATTIAPYRAMVLARLAWVAAACSAPALADRWLDAVPRGLAIPEIAGDVRVAEAMTARARGDAKEVLRILGEGEVEGVARGLAGALRVDAHETNGDGKLARGAWREASRAGSSEVLGAARTFALASSTRRIVVAMSIGAVLGLASVLLGFVAVIQRCTNDTPIGLVPIGMIVVGLALASLLTRL